MPPASFAARSIILVVEDDPDLRDLYRTALRNAGHAVVALEDGLDALRFLETSIPDAVVLDLGLPRLRGEDVSREMTAQGLSRHVPIVVVTGDPRAEIEDQGFACVLRKPIDPADLVAAVDRCIRAARA